MTHLAWFAALLLADASVAQERLAEGEPRAVEEMSPEEGPSTYSSSRAYNHYLQAKLRESRGEILAALDQMRQAALYDEGDGALRLELAKLRLKAGQPVLARQELQAILQVEPRNPRALMMVGLLDQFEGRRRDAIRSLEAAIAAAPASEDAYLLLIKVRVDGGEWEEAAKLAEALGEWRPGEGKAWRVLAALAREQGAGAQEERFLRRAVAAEPSHLSSVLELATLDERAGRDAAAVEGYAAVLRRNPTDPTALLGAARIALRRGEDAGARAYLRQLFGTHPDPIGVRLQTALDMQQAKRDAAALEVLKEADAFSEDPRIPFFRGIVLEGKGSLHQAAGAYRQVPASAGPLYPLARVRWANVMSRLGQHDEALRLLEVARSTAARVFDDDLHGEVLRFVPDLYRRAGKSPEAVSLLQKSAEAMPDSEAVRIALANALLDTGRGGEAIDLLEADAQDPGEPVLFALAVAKERVGDPEGAVEVAERILERSPGNPSILNFMGYVLADHGIRLDEARALLIRAVELRPDDPAFLDSLGWCELQRGDLEAAEPYLLRAAEQLPDDPEVLHHLAELYLRTDRAELAIATWQRALQALRQDPDFRLKGIIEQRLVNAPRQGG